ncbi:L-lactate MFS transporter [Streptococcus marmotae]|uniref:L-lactate MFS transporter n=1 Tax=Streptococcus marmotae TaxID=1825069 RepID=UPI000835F83C|nr:OFA family MFS transporter [Streptococcus marmotae]
MKKTANRWLILIAAILTNLSLGAGYAWSVFQKALLETNANQGWVQAQTSLAFSISFAMVPVGMILFGPKVDELGPKKFVFLGGILFGLGMFATGFATSLPILYMTYGLVLGLGIGAAYGASTSVATKWFPDKKGLAGGLTAAGFGLGPLIIGPVAKSMIASMGIYRTFNVLGIALLLIICASSIVMEKAPAVTPAGGSVAPTGKTHKEMLREGNFWLLWLIYVLGATGGMMIIGSAASISDQYKLVSEATFFVMLVSIANTFGRIFWGIVSDKIGRYPTVIAMFATVAGGLFLTATFKGEGNILAVLGVMMVALSFGGFLGSFPGITAENWGVANVGTNYGWMFTAYGVAAIAGPQLGARLAQANGGDYTPAFFIVIGMALVGIVLQLFYMTKSRKNKE